MKRQTQLKYGPKLWLTFAELYTQIRGTAKPLPKRPKSIAKCIQALQTMFTVLTTDCYQNTVCVFGPHEFMLHFKGGTQSYDLRVNVKSVAMKRNSKYIII